MFCGIAGVGFAPEAVAENLRRRYGVTTLSTCPDLTVFGTEVAPTWGNFDPDLGRLTLRRDRLGQQALYYCRKDGRLGFADNLSLLRYLTENATVSAQSVSDFLALGYIPDPDTLYVGISTLPPAHQLEFDCNSGELTVTRYWDFPPADPALSWGEAQEKLRMLLTQAVEKLLANGDCGLLLSGGLDSAVVGSIAAQLGAKLPAFTIGFPDAKYDESKRAQRSAEFLSNVDWRHWELTPGSFAAAGQLLTSSGELLGDASLWATRQLCLWAGKTVQLALTGDGADEFLGGYERYRAMTIGRRVLKIPAFLRTAAARLGEFLPGQGERSPKMRSRRFWSGLQASEADTYFNYLNRYSRYWQRRLAGEKPVSAARHFDRLSKLPGQSAAERCSRLDWYTYLPGDALAKSRLAAAGSGLVIASPFLSDEVVEFCAALPWQFKQAGSVRKKLLGATFAAQLPPGLLHARKRGFGVPISRFIRENWSAEIRAELLDGPLAKLGLSRSGMAELLREHLDQKADNSYLLWHLAVLSVYLRQQAQ